MRREPGTYRITFDDRRVLRRARRSSPRSSIVFVVHDAAQHYHVPLLLSPFGYSTVSGAS